VRHGRSTFNDQGLYQGCCDQSELTERGRLEARLAAQALASAGIRFVVASPLRRALDTAREILDEFRRERLPVPCLQTDDRLKEVDLAEWQGLRFDEVSSRYSEQYEIWRSQPHLLRMSTASGSTFPVLDLFERARLFWEDLLSDDTRKSVLIVAHGGTCSALISTALRIGPERFHTFQQSHAGISAIEFPSRPGRALVETFNSVSHLGENLPKTKAGKTGLRLLLVAPPDSYTLGATHFQRVLLDAHADGIISGHSPSGRERLEEMIATAEFSALATVLVIVPQQELCATLGRLLRMDEQTAARFQLRAMSLTVIHYPRRGCPPLLQAVNLFDGAGEAAGLQCLDREWSCV
jgi:probable phosphoglycerate mutase